MHKESLVKLLKIAITIAIFAILVITFDIDLAKVFSGIVDYKYLLFALAIPIAIIPFISTNRWKLFLHHVGVEESVFSLIKINFVSMFQGLVLPSSQGFDVLRVLYIEQRHPERRGAVGSTILIERVVGFVVLCVLSLTFSILSNIPEKKKVLLIIGGISVLLVVAILVLLDKRINSFISNIKFKKIILNKICQYCSKFSNALINFPYGKVLVSSIMLILLFQLATIASVAMIFKAYGLSIPFSTHISLYPIISILSLVPITISGFGLREGFFVYFYSSLGVSADIAVSVSLMNYLVLTGVPAMMGAVIYVYGIFKKNHSE